MSNILKQSGYHRLEEAFHIQPRLHLTSIATTDETVPAAATESAQHERCVLDAQSRAEALLKAAKQKAEQMQAEAKATIELWWNEQREQDRNYKEEIRQQAYDEGYVQGYEQGVQKAHQEIDEQLKQAQQIVDSSYIAKEQIICEAEPFLVRLSLDVAEKVIARQIETDNTVIVDMVHSALERYHEAGIITVLVKPKYFPLVQEARDELKQYLNDHIELKVIPDRTIGSDGCVIRSHHGSIDARVDVQLDQIKQVLLEVAKEGDSAGDSVPYEVPTAPLKAESDSR